MEYAFNMSQPISGLKFCSVDTKSNFKVAILTASFALPLNSDTAANALLPGLLKRTCKKYPTLTQMNRHLASLYGAMVSGGVGKDGENQILTLRVTVLEDRFSLSEEKISSAAADLLLDLIFEPNLVDGKFAEEDIEREKRLMIEQIESELNDKRYYALKRCTEIMCENEVYSLSRWGEIEDIKSLDSARLIKAWKNMLSSAIVHIGVTGSMNADVIRCRFEQKFEDIDRSRLADLHTEFITSAYETKRVREEMPVKQGKLVLGMRAGMTDADDNYVAIKVMCDIFGGGVYSKLFNNVREKMSLCYYCSAGYNRSKGLIMVQSGIENENEQKAIDAILAQLEDIQKGNFTDDELDASIKGLTSLALGVCDTPEGIDRWYGGQMLDSDVITPEEYAEQIAAITREQVIAAAQCVTLDTVYMLAGTGTEDDEEGEVNE
ncbi:MAG: pitrilysin family protein [Acutalibacteraceae bacterium]|nr:pitrilysin family protein [Acutalibacteraceae bacterium]